MREHYYVGVDLGQARDPSAIAILEYSEVPGTVRDPVRFNFPVIQRLALRQVERLPLGTEFSGVARRVGQIARYLANNNPGRYGQSPVTLVIDATGVGRPVVEMIRKEPLQCAQVVPVMITGGSQSHQTGGFWHVPKTELIMRLATMVDRAEFFVAANLRNKEAWLAEMLSVKAGTLSGNPDDLVIATALACWRARRGKIGESNVPLRFN